MSKHETWRTRLYWQSVGGLLIEEFRAIRQNRKESIGHRDLDGVIVLGEEPRIQHCGTFDFSNRDIIVIQTKATRIGMYLMGQAFFSGEIMKRYKPRSIKKVAICGKPDPEMVALCQQHDVEVVCIPDHEKPADL